MPQESTAHRERGNETYFTFNRVFDEQASQDSLFAEVVRPKVDTCVSEGKNLLLFAYGMTNAGKTYTIAGSDTNPGLLPRTLSHLFRAHLSGQADSSNLSVEVSYCEIYNEQLFDLLAGAKVNTGTLRRAPPRTGTSNSLKIRQDKEGRTYVQGLRNLKVSDARTALSLFAEGQKNKHMAETSLNRDSSRSHAIFTITMFDGTDDNRHVRTRINIVDLAGSERARRTQAVGKALKEAGKINNSLSVLGRCLDALRNNSNNAESLKRIPFRESRLTELFSDHLAGSKSGYTLMLLNTGPAPLDYDETMQALKYGVAASEIKVKATRTSVTKDNTLYNYDGHRIRRGNTAKGSINMSGKPAMAQRSRAQKRSLMNAVPEHEEQPKKRATGNFRSHKQQSTEQPEQPQGEKTESVYAKEEFEKQVNEQMQQRLDKERQNWNEEKEQLNSRIEELEEDNEELSARVQQMDDDMAQLEADIRAEVGEEMAERLQALEEEYNSSMQQESTAAEQHMQRKMYIKEKLTTGFVKKTASRLLGRKSSSTSGSYNDSRSTQSNNDRRNKRLSQRSSSSQSSSLVPADRAELEQQVSELQEQLQECESELDRTKETLRTKQAEYASELKQKQQALETTQEKLQRVIEEKGDLYRKLQQLEGTSELNYGDQQDSEVWGCDDKPVRRQRAQPTPESCKEAATQPSPAKTERSEERDSRRQISRNTRRSTQSSSQKYADATFESVGSSMSNGAWYVRKANAPKVKKTYGSSSQKKAVSGDTNLPPLPAEDELPDNSAEDDESNEDSSDSDETNSNQETENEAEDNQQGTAQSPQENSKKKAPQTAPQTSIAARVRRRRKGE